LSVNHAGPAFSPSADCTVLTFSNTDSTQSLNTIKPIKSTQLNEALPDIVFNESLDMIIDEAHQLINDTAAATTTDTSSHTSTSNNSNSVHNVDVDTPSKSKNLLKSKNSEPKKNNKQASVNHLLYTKADYADARSQVLACAKQFIDDWTKNNY